MEGNPLDYSRVTVPLRRARELLVMEAEAEIRVMQNNPDYAHF
jgi:hypothetical protein